MLFLRLHCLHHISINILGLGPKKMTISWVLGGVLPKSKFRFLRLDLPWDFGKKLPMSGCINSHVDLGNSLLTIFYIFFPAMDSGLFILRYRHPPQKMPIFWFGGPNPSQPEIRRVTIFRFIFYPSTQPKKTYIWITIKLVIVCFDRHFHEQKCKWMERQIINPVSGMTSEWRIRINNIETPTGH